MEYLLVIYHDEAELGTMSDEERQTELAAYQAFNQTLIDAGAMRGGNALTPTATARSVRVRDGKVMTTDGPFAETKEQLGGYYLIDCASMEEACAHAARIPAAFKGTVEVRAIWNY